MLNLIQMVQRFEDCGILQFNGFQHASRPACELKFDYLLTANGLRIHFCIIVLVVAIVVKFEESNLKFEQV